MKKVNTFCLVLSVCSHFKTLKTLITHFLNQLKQNQLLGCLVTVNQI